MLATPTRLNLALPNSQVLKYGDETRLAIESNSWVHLICYMERLEKLPFPTLGAPPSPTDNTEKLRLLLPTFGTPYQLAMSLKNTPNLLQGTQTPKPIYEAINCLIRRNEEGSAVMIKNLETMAQKPKSSIEIQDTLLMLAQLATSVMSPIGDILSTLDQFNEKCIKAHLSFSLSCQNEADVLHTQQEKAFDLQEKIDNVRSQISSLGFFGQGKKSELMDQLKRLENEFQQTSDQSGKIRTQLSILEPLLAEGCWLQSGLNDLSDFINKLRKLWAEVGTNMAQLAIDASDAQLHDPAWLKTTLGCGDAIHQWRTIHQASSAFLEHATHSFLTRNH